MSTPKITRCADGHFRRVIYGLGPYIADYPEQALLACVVQGWCPKCTASKYDLDGADGGHCSREHTEELVAYHELGDLWEDYGIVGDIVPFTNDFPHADIHQLLSPDILHQVIKGTFKDHLVDWVETYLVQTHGKMRAQSILADIDRQIAVIPPFSNLRRFHEGRGFKQWTGDDSKALMKVYLPALVGYVPREMRNVHTPETLAALQDALQRFHEHRAIFQTTGVRSEGFSLPRQHSLSHYYTSIWAFSALNGLCSSITESKHIEAVKNPWRCSNHYEAAGQILLTNQRVDKLAASRVDFKEWGMLEGTCLSEAWLALNPDMDPPSYSDPSDADASNAERTVNTQRKDDRAVDGPPVLLYVKRDMPIMQMLLVLRSTNLACWSSFADFYTM
ncbi:hypothetical protein A0H81_14159 [Grifola frondosa]|uniref:Uncharacterized protein n=1 Tax=Grifola frondosa TaxID=5627 RepID=A0A1C7LME5_GRIFR|nr:hypothetical protein A0H81_14159 [Grifola frondosa]